ncbi:SDR family oxidoreductase [Pendulispora brunnea]|uniref:SDR family oxidoreductase n=1 Tax=Pendulispora brunnea TaxID=2905690 RepID=A0ABZ2KAW2_9BACT
MQLSGKIALVTGGTSGIGAAAVRRLASEGARVIVVGREGPRLRPSGVPIERTEPIAADVTDPDAIARLMSEVKTRHGRLDVLVINAGVATAPPIQELAPASYEALMGVNCKGAVFTFVHALPLLAEGASVIFVGSVAARKGQPGDALYAGSKGFLRAFARNAGTDPDLLQRRIRVNVVTPGPIDTPLSAAATADPQVRAYVERLIPMGRWGKAEEVAEAILFLGSPASSFTTGAEITVDGGMSHA